MGVIGGFLIRGSLQKSMDGIKIIGVIDGDTIVTENKVGVRLRYVDAPELEFCGGQEAKEILEKLVSDKKVRIEEQIIDQQGRPMALIYTGGKLINSEMLASGWAKYHSDTTNLTQDIKKAANEAREKKIGIFSDKCTQTINPEKTSCNIKGNVDANDLSVKTYHVPGCVQYNMAVVELYRGEQWFCTEAEARKAGYVKSKRCP